ncbi:MAG: hypothetical protein KY394_00260 [Actinobacteria bacterium]|nr:hypothetical protein [Actinomycetota bacterium]
MTNRGHRTPALLFLLSLAMLIPAVAFAQEEGEETTTTIAATETTVAEAPATTTGLRPAVEVLDEEEVAANPQWTYRYLIPTALVLAVLIILVISIRYFSDVVRNRYRVIEE